MLSLRILFLTQTYPRYPTDTAGPFIREIARGLVRAGDAVTILVPHTAGLDRAWDDDGIRVESFRYAPEFMEQVGYSRSLQRDEVVKIASAVAAPLYALGARRAVARALGGNSGETRFDVFHAHWIVPNGIATASLLGPATLKRRPVIGFGLHGSDVFLAEKHGVRRLVSNSMGKADFLTGCSPELLSRVSRLGELGGPHSCSAVIPYGIDASDFGPGKDAQRWRRRLGIADHATVVLGVGRMATKKGFQILLEVAEPLLQQNPTVHVVLAGGGDREAEFRRRVGAFEGRVHFPGLVERDQLADLYRAADIFCLPAVHDEQGNVDGLPNVILEAMATGLPVVSTDVSGIPLAVLDGETGLLVKEGDSGSLQSALQRLINQPDLGKQFGLTGRRRVVKEFTWDQTSRKYRDVYLRALGLRQPVQLQGKE